MKKQKIDCLLIHTSTDNHKREAFIMFMAMGIFALADLLEKNGFSTKIIHLGVEKILNKQFSIEDYLKNKKIRLIGISLHWYHQSRKVIRLVNQIKTVCPQIKIVLGGFTASFFCNEIMEKYKNIDFIIRGDGEIPLLYLMKELVKDKQNYFAVPNLSWRKEKEISHNNQDYIASEEDINKLNFSNFNLLNNFPTYTRVPLRLLIYSKKLLLPFRTYFLCVGRGCSVNCSFCGGSNLSQQTINKRKSVIFRSLEKVLETIQDAVSEGIDCLYVSFDPEPKREYYFQLFKLIREKNIKISFAFECWSLPSRKFIDEYKRTFGKGKYSKLIISPETACEKVREFNKGFYYSNKELLQVIDYLIKKRIYSEIYFSYPLPGESDKDRKLTSNFINLMKKKIGNRGKILIQNFGLDPASPMFLNPKKYNIIRKAIFFADYCKMTRSNDLFRNKGFNNKEFCKAYQKWLRENKMVKLVGHAYNYFQLNNYRQAVKIANKTIKLGYKNDIYFFLGSCYERMRNYKKAIYEYKKAEKISPDEPRINYSLFNCYKKQGEDFNASFEFKKWLVKSKYT